MVGVSGDGDEILSVIGQRFRSVREEEGHEFSMFDRAEVSDK